jgi:putative PEP-CTERM system TPR-repeat lipoprotein
MTTFKRPIPTLLAIMIALSLAGCGKTPEEHLAQGKALMAKGESQSAILEFKTALQDQPNNPEARLTLGNSYLTIQSYPEAEKELRKALELGADPDLVIPALSKAVLGQGDAKKVLDIALPPAGLSRQSLAAFHALRAEAHFRLRNSAEGQASLIQAEQADANQVDLLLLKARMAAAQKQFGDAHKLLLAALDQDKQLLDAYYIQAAIHEAENKPEDAIQSYKQALVINPKAYRAHLAISDIEFGRGQAEAGLKALQTAEKLAPKAPLVRYARGIYELRSNNLRAANEALQSFLSVAPDYMPAQLASAMANLGLGNLEQSLKAAQLVLAREPENSLAARVLAASQIKSGDPAQALATLTPFIKGNPDDAASLALAGEAYFQNRNYQQALASFQRAGSIAPQNTNIRTQEAATLAALGKSDLALAELEQAVQGSAKAGRADVALISLHMQRKEYDKALQAIGNLEKKIPQNAQTLNLRAAALLGKKDQAGARAALEQALKLDPKFFVAAANLARLDIAAKQPQAAKKRFEAILSQDPNHLQAMMAMAELAIMAKQETEYVSWLEKASKAHPDAQVPRALLARYYLSKKDSSKAIDVAENAVRGDAGNLQALNLLGTTQLASNDPQAAIKTFRALAQKAPDSPEAQLRLGIALAAAKANTEAREALNKALRLKADFVPAMDALVQLEIQAENPTAALQWARKIQTAQPLSPLGPDREGDVLASQKRFAEAAKAYQQALAKGGNVQSMLNAVSAFDLAGTPGAAQAVLDQWLKAKPNDLATRAYTAARAARTGQSNVAIAQLEEILRQKPQDGLAMNNLAILYQARNDPRALKLAAQAYQTLPDQPAVLDTYGWILLQQDGQSAKALSLLEKAAERAANSPAIQYHYAVALAKSGKKAEARTKLENLLRTHPVFPDAQAAQALLSSLK